MLPASLRAPLSVSALLLLLVVGRARAQADAPGHRWWGTVGVASGFSFTQHHSAYQNAVPLTARGGVAIRLSPRYGVRVDGSATLAWPSEDAIACVPEATVAGHCPGPQQLGGVFGGSMALAVMTDVASGIPGTT